MSAPIVMLVDDDADVRSILPALISPRGFNVLTAADGQEALDKLHDLNAEHRPCLLLLDLMMPGMDGWEFLAKVRADPDYRNLSIALLSGVADLQAEARSLQVVEYLTKPVDFQKLFALLRSHCGAAGGPEDSEA